MHAILIALLFSAAAPPDTLFIANGGRVRGSVVEESSQAVSIQLLDGTMRRYEIKDVTRIEYGDGSVSTPRPPAPPPAPAPAPGAQVITPQVGGAPQVVVAGGTASQPSTIVVMPCPAPPAPAAVPPPPEPALASHAGNPPTSPIYLTLGLGGLTMSGNIEKDVSTSTIFGDQVNLQAEVGLRATPSTAFAIYFDLGVGDPATGIASSSSCAAVQGGCVASTGRLGILVRHTFSPAAPRTGWLAFGTGAEFGSVTVGGQQGQGMMDKIYNYKGWEALRVMLGYDWRGNSVLGFGLYGGVGWGKYTSVETGTGTRVSIADPAYHTTVEAGVRMTLFP
jgi:hypothetical protein